MDEDPSTSTYRASARRQAKFEQLALETERLTHARADRRQWREVDSLTEEAERQRIRGSNPRLTDDNFGATVRHGDGENDGDVDVGIDWF
jgi:hypothetical protein